MLRIRDTYPDLTVERTDIFALNHRFNSEFVPGITERIHAESAFFILNIRGYIPNRFFQHKMPLSDYLVLNADLEEDTINLPCGNWYVDASFHGEKVKCRLEFFMQDRDANNLNITPKENFYFVDAFNYFYKGMTEISGKYRTIKTWKSNKNYATDLLGLQTGFVSRENALTRKFYTDTDKYYRTKLGIGRK